MLSEKQVVDRIIELRARFEDDEGGWEGDEGEIAELTAYETVLDRDLTEEENQRCIQFREETNDD